MIAEHKARRKFTDSTKSTSGPTTNRTGRRTSRRIAQRATLPGFRNSQAGRGYDRDSAARETERPAPVASREQTRTRPRPAAKVHRDTALTAIMIVCTAITCILLVCYLAVFANVQYLSYQLRSEQSKLSKATARQHELIDRIGRLSSPDQISSLAPSMNMELPTTHAYIDVPTGASAAAPHGTVMAAAN